MTDFVFIVGAIGIALVVLGAGCIVLCALMMSGMEREHDSPRSFWVGGEHEKRGRR